MASPTGPPAGGRRILGLKPRTALIGGGLILGGALLFFWWRSRQSSSSADTAAQSSTANAAAYSDAGALDALQSELDQLLQQEDNGTGSSAPGGATSPPTTVPTKTATPPKTTTPPKTAAKPKPAMPSGVHETKVTPTSVTISWTKDPNATSYRVRVTYQSKLVGTPHLVTGTSATISGLAPLRTYTFHVAAIGPGGTSSETNGPAVKTK